jgi:hypothetical protein
MPNIRHAGDGDRVRLGSVDEWFRHDQEEISNEQNEPAGVAESRDDWPA